MKNLEGRLKAVERRLEPPPMAGLVLVLNGHATPEQLEAIARAEAEDRPVLLVRVVDCAARHDP